MISLRQDFFVNKSASFSELQSKSYQTMEFSFESNRHCDPVRFATCCLLIAVLGLSLSIPCMGQAVSDRVVVTASTPTRINRDIVGEVYEGEIHTVVAIKGKWCAVDEVEGWLPMKNVMSVRNAMSHFDSRIEKNKNDFIALAHRGMINYENEAYDRAFFDLNESLKINKQNAATWNNRGRVRHAQQKYGLALQDIEYAIKLNPNFPLAHYNLGRVWHSLGDWEKAIASYDKAIELYDKNSTFFVNRGISKMMGKKSEEARKDFERATELNPRNPDAFVGMSNLELSLGDPEKALEYSSKAINMAPKHALALNARGWANYKLGRIDDAIVDLRQAIRFSPKFPLAYNNRGVCLAAMGEFSSAVLDYDEALKLNPGDPIAMSNRGRAYFEMGEYEKARVDLNQSVEKSPKLPEALDGLAFFLATCSDEKYRDGKKSLEYAQLANEIMKETDSDMLLTLAAAHAETGDFERAVAIAEKALAGAANPKKTRIQEAIGFFSKHQPLRSGGRRTATAASSSIPAN
jgi:tetratricopeptide (TPR) repeat protein